MGAASSLSNHLSSLAPLTSLELYSDSPYRHGNGGSGRGDDAFSRLVGAAPSTGEYPLPSSLMTSYSSNDVSAASKMLDFRHSMHDSMHPTSYDHLSLANLAALSAPPPVGGFGSLLHHPSLTSHAGHSASSTRLPLAINSILPPSHSYLQNAGQGQSNRHYGDVMTGASNNGTSSSYRTRDPQRTAFEIHNKIKAELAESASASAYGSSNGAAAAVGQSMGGGNPFFRPHPLHHLYPGSAGQHDVSMTTNLANGTADKRSGASKDLGSLHSDSRSSSNSSGYLPPHHLQQGSSGDSPSILDLDLHGSRCGDNRGLYSNGSGPRMDNDTVWRPY